MNKMAERFAERSAEILGENLVGVYLHGSAAMGCYNPAKSDLDLIVVTGESPDDDCKRAYMDMVMEIHALLSGKDAGHSGIEMSIVRRDACNPFVYPTPFELHFSAMHQEWYRRDPEDYIRKMKGTDKDLAAHFTVIRHRGRCLAGRARGGLPGFHLRRYRERAGRNCREHNVLYAEPGKNARIPDGREDPFQGGRRRMGTDPSAGDISSAAPGCAGRLYKRRRRAV